MIRHLCFFIFILTKLHETKGFLFQSNGNWNNLKVTWGINPFSSNNFAPLPRTENEAIQKGWTKEKDCSQVLGNRYVRYSQKLNFNLYIELIFLKPRC